ncbi:DUF1801 domain-containing protein [Mariniluteicoccus endophyticus]
MTKHAGTLDEFWARVPEARRDAAERLFETISDNIDPAYEQRMYCGMPTWFVPRERYPQGYHCDPSSALARISLGNMGGHLAVYDMGMYADPEVSDWFVAEYAKTGWKLNMGKSCVRFTAMSRIPYELIGCLAARIPVDRFVATYAAHDPRNKN